MLADAAVVLLLAMALALPIAARRRREVQQRSEGEFVSDEGVLLADVVDIEARLNRVDADATPLREAMIESRLLPLLRRRVPVHVVEAVPELHAARIRFADGTTFVGRGESAGDAGVLAAMLRHHAVCAARWHRDALGTHVVFGCAGRRRQVGMILVGLEQAA